MPEAIKKRLTKKQRVRDFIAERGWTAIGEKEWMELRAALAGVSESALRACGIPIAAPWSAVATHSLEDLERSLREMSRIYEQRVDLRRYCRDQVIGAKDRTRWIAGSPKVEDEKRRVKSEMVEWMLVWLDDPAMFPQWVNIRLTQMRAAEPEP